MRNIVVKGMELKLGRPQIAAIITGRNHDEIIEQVIKAKKLPCQMLEWRADYYFADADELREKMDSTAAHMEMIRILDDIDDASHSMPLMFTLMSKSAGGQTEISRESAYDLASLAAQSKLVDFVNVDFFSDEGTLEFEQMINYVSEIHEFGIRVIHSHHEYGKSLTLSETITLAQNMRNMGADIIKIACDVNSLEESRDLLKASAVLTADEDNPVIIIGIGKEGLITRIAGGKFGSCISFAYIDEPTAEGQLDVKTLAEELDRYYE